MELRFIEGDFPHGKFKLQMRREIHPTRKGADGEIERYTSYMDWEDVPCVMARPNEWCEHLKFRQPNDYSRGHWVFDFTGGQDSDANCWDADVYKFKFCPICGAKRP